MAEMNSEMNYDLMDSKRKQRTDGQKKGATERRTDRERVELRNWSDPHTEYCYRANFYLFFFEYLLICITVHCTVREGCTDNRCKRCVRKTKMVVCHNCECVCLCVCVSECACLYLCMCVMKRAACPGQQWRPQQYQHTIQTFLIDW